MKIKEPKLRFPTQQARIELADELNLEYHDEMQDWEWEVAKSDEIEKYISHYKTLRDDDKKFTLMEIIIQAMTDQDSVEKLEKYWQIVKVCLQENFKLHSYSIYYWSCFENDLENCWQITPYMRNAWKDSNVG